MNAFPVSEVEDELKGLQEEAARIEGEIRRRRQLLDARNRFLGVAEDKSGQVHLAQGVVIPGAAARHSIAQTAESQRAVQRAIQNASRTAAKLVKAEQQGAADSVRKAAREAKALETRIQIAENAGGNEEQVGPEVRSRAGKLLQFLKAHPGETWKLSDIRDRLVEEGILEDDPVDTHGLQVSASRLYRTGRIERPTPGHYRVPADAGEAMV